MTLTKWPGKVSKLTSRQWLFFKHFLADCFLWWHKLSDARCWMQLYHDLLVTSMVVCQVLVVIYHLHVQLFR